VNIKERKVNFIEKSKIIHGNKYDYSLVKYKNNKTKVEIICPEHGIFEQRPDDHSNGKGCILCGGSNKKSLDNFIKESKIIHGDKYDYSLVKYKNNKTKVKIICPEHGIFEQMPVFHIHKKYGCPICNLKNKKSLDDFIKESKIIHGDKYDYSLVKYKNNKTKVKIICSEHGIFKQEPKLHIHRKYGCPKCYKSKGELEISKYLESLEIKYEEQKIFKDCKNISSLKFDFYLPKHNICIEYDGIQHFKPLKYFGGEKAYNKIKNNDIIKNNFCEKNNINLIRISYLENISEKIKKEII